MHTQYMMERTRKKMPRKKTSAKNNIMDAAQEHIGQEHIGE